MSQTACFAAGCFWSVELVYQRLEGVTETSVGYTGGHVDSPTYRQVCNGNTGHAEAVQVKFDPEITSYGKLLEVFFNKHDPTTPNRQGNDVGTQYRSAIFYHSEEQKALAEEKCKEVEQKLGRKVVTEIAPAPKFWPAEDYHQRYLEKGGQCASKGCGIPIRCYG